MNSRAGTILCVLALAAMACSEGSAPSAPTRPSPSTPVAKAPTPSPAPSPTEPTPVATPEPEDLVEKGKQAYLSNCIACHNPDPSVDGALGPAVLGASAELLEARVMRGEYPEGYKPKRDTAAMIPMPFLEAHLPALAAYLGDEGSG